MTYLLRQFLKEKEGKIRLLGSITPEAKLESEGARYHLHFHKNLDLKVGQLVRVFGTLHNDTIDVDFVQNADHVDVDLYMRLIKKEGFAYEV
jgi:hypothetical protein